MGLSLFDEGIGIDIHGSSHLNNPVAHIQPVNLFPVVGGSWASTLVGSGAVSQTPGYLLTNTGVTASSSAILYARIRGFSSGVTAFNNFNWAKKTYFIFNLTIQNADTEATGRIQLKNAVTIGALGAVGIGVQVNNLTLLGESYGASVATVDLNTALTADTVYRIVVVHSPDDPKIDWYVDGVLVGTQSTAAKIPTTAGTESAVAVSAANGGTGGVSYNCIGSTIWVGQLI